MSSFFVTLLSNTPLPGNKTGDFTTILPEKLSFADPSEWEVALMSISYPNSFETLGHFGQQEIKARFESGEEISFAATQGTYDTTDKIQQMLTDLFKQHALPAAINFCPQKSRFKLRIETGVEWVELPSQIQYLLGFKQNKFSNGTFTADYPYDPWAGLHQIFIYCNVISDQVVANTKTNLLRVCNVRGHYGDLIEETFMQPQFCTVLHREISEINVQLRCSGSLPIKFAWGAACLVLCFRKKSIF